MAVSSFAAMGAAIAQMPDDSAPELPTITRTLIAGTTKETISVDGTDRTYLLHVPEKLKEPAALLLSIHGNGGNALSQERLSGYSRLAEDEGFIVVYPQSRKDQWHVYSEEPMDVRYVDVLLADLAGRYKIDAKRVYANGISLGAQFAWRLACERPNIFAAAGLVAGGYPGVCNMPRIPLIIFHGTKDDILPYDGADSLMPVRDFARGWAARETCRLASEGEIVFEQGDAKGERWQCDPVGEVILYSLEGKGHSWPGSGRMPRITSKDVDASKAMWNFFKSHPKP
jgi:polyhydroxybutyrate depolymerase